MKKKECVLYDRLCTECGECLRCDLDPEKICDNCGACLDESGDDFASILITAMENPDDGMMQTLRPVENGLSTPDLHHHHGNCDCGHDHHCDDDCSCAHEHHHHHEPQGFSQNLAHPGEEN